MSLYGATKSAVITIATDDDLSAEVDLGLNADYLQIVLPALTSTTVSVYVSLVPGGTFVSLGSSVATATTTGSYATMFLLGGYQFIKIKTSVGQSANRTFEVRGMKI